MAEIRVDQYVGARLRLRRKLLGYSQTRLGEAVGLTFQQIQKYEKGKSRIGASRLWALGGILRVPVTYFFDGLEQPAPVLEETVSASELRLCTALRRLPVRQRRKLYELVMIFAEMPKPLVTSQ
ncbi:MAG: helix-turn-helix domain-containing protein [Alphaproteobacteria bacterium]|nr:helix-turn-helix domain-containing protein [Alphaproteobacteria bacterium]